MPLIDILKLKHPDLDEDEPSAELPPWSAWKICEVVAPHGLRHSLTGLQAWALQRGYLTAKAARPDAYRAANSILRFAGSRLRPCLQSPTVCSRRSHRAVIPAAPLPGPCLDAHIACLCRLPGCDLPRPPHGITCADPIMPRKQDTRQRRRRNDAYVKLHARQSAPTGVISPSKLLQSDDEEQPITAKTAAKAKLKASTNAFASLAADD